MSTEDFWPRFRNQFNDEEWAKLNKRSDFREALISADSINIAALADKILIGDAKSLKQQRQMNADHKRFGINATA